MTCDHCNIKYHTFIPNPVQRSPSEQRTLLNVFVLPTSGEYRVEDHGFAVRAVSTGPSQDKSWRKGTVSFLACHNNNNNCYEYINT